MMQSKEIFKQIYFIKAQTLGATLNLYRPTIVSYFQLQSFTCSFWLVINFYFLFIIFIDGLNFIEQVLVRKMVLQSEFHVENGNNNYNFRWK